MLWQPRSWSPSIIAEHHRRQLLRLHLTPRRELADVVVLAEHAAEVAHGEEDRAAALRAAQAVLLAEVREGRAHLGPAPDAADLGLVGQPVHLAVPGADPAAGELRHGLRGATGELAGREVEVGGAEVGSGVDEVGREGGGHASPEV
jgi:hypothetical protein